jgi:hypothetical protein
MRALFAVMVLLSMAAIVGVSYVIAHSRSRGHQPGMPDGVSDEVVSGLMAELRKSQAEAAYWKSNAQRLQRELDQRG